MRNSFICFFVICSILPFSIFAQNQRLETENDLETSAVEIADGDGIADEQNPSEAALPSVENSEETSVQEPKTETASSINFKGLLPFVPYHENDGKKHYISALTGMLVFNAGMSSWNRFVIGSNWAKTGPAEWSHFWRRRLSWDNDWYWTNFVLHPYQGNLYYMSSRNANLNFFESMAVTIIGSGIWEYLCETNSPSKNDMIYTTVGSFAVGEMLYRLSMCADEKIPWLGYIINPMRLASEPITRQKPRNPHGNIHELYLSFGGGATTAYTNLINCTDYDWDKFELYPAFATPELFVVYNDPFTADSNSPYNHFELKIKGAAGAGSGNGADCEYAKVDKKMMYNLRIESNGYIWSRSPKSSDNVDTSMGIILLYDFDWHSFYELSSLAPGVAIKQRITFDKSRIEWQVHEAGIILGTTDFYYFHRQLVNPYTVTSRNYSYTIGAQAVTKFKFQTEKGFAVNFSFRGYAMYDFYNQMQRMATTGWEFIGIGNLGLEFPLSKIVRIGIADEAYAKRTYYKKYDDVFQFVNTGNLYVKWQLK